MPSELFRPQLGKGFLQAGFKKHVRQKSSDVRKMRFISRGFVYVQIGTPDQDFLLFLSLGLDVFIIVFFSRMPKPTVRQIINNRRHNENYNMEHAVDTVLPYLLLGHIFLLLCGVGTI